jgi:uncharacterized repeat protein (TIGR01451 family)
MPKSLVRARLAAVAFVSCAVALGATAAAASAQGSGYFVTFVSRSCPAYTDIYANRARNNILESLQDLGPDTQYGTSGRLVNPDDENKPPQDVCSPISGWQFTLGRSYQSRAVTGPWGSLSIATNVFQGSPIVTKSSTPLLDQNAVPIDNQQIAGATTIELSKEERQQASSPDQLWAQGGTPTDPVLANTFPGPEYGFGALRCATDNLNGDNVEYIYFPAGVTHVFCYGLYVKPSPTAGLITIQKHVAGTPSGDDPAFPFNGTISYDPSGFQLANGGSIDFYRAGGASWNVTEGGVDNYRLTSVDCTARTLAGGPGKSTMVVKGSTTSIDLVAGEHVTCIYSNEYVPPKGGLTIRKVTRGGVGLFAYRVTPASGGKSHLAHATTTQPNVPVDAEPSPLNLAPGTYTIRERATPTTEGHWRTVRVRCNDADRATTHPVQVTIRSGVSTTCTFVNAFTPAGSISLAKITDGGTGTSSFLVSSHSGTPVQYLQHATTTASGVTADAVPVTGADATDHLRLGPYSIVEQLPASDPADGWALTSVLCNGVLQPFAQGTVQVSLTRAVPHVRCVFTDTFSSHPEPPAPPPIPPTPPAPPPTPPAPIYELSDLAVTKHASPTVVTRGEIVSYRVTVSNLGPDPAQRVALGDQPLGPALIVSVHSPVGRCTVRPRIVCQLGTLNAGSRVVVTIALRPVTGSSRFTNRAVVGTATSERTLANNVALASVRVIAPPSPPPGRG